VFCHDFATVRLRAIRFIQRIRDFSSRDVSFYAAKNDYALYASLGPRIDTVEVWGSNPHAPTKHPHSDQEVSAIALVEHYLGE